MPTDDLRQGIIGLLRQSYADLWVELLDARCRQTQNLHVNAGVIHVFDPVGADIQKPAQQDVTERFNGLLRKIESAGFFRFIFFQAGF